MSRRRQGSYPSSGVQRFKHFPKDFLRPYGLAIVGTEATDNDSIQRRLKPVSCEWLNRPGIAVSEFIATLEQNFEPAFANLDLLKNVGMKRRAKVYLNKLCKHGKFAKRNFRGTFSEKKKKKKCKRFLKQLRETSEETDAFLDECMKTGASLYLMGIHHRVAKYIATNISTLQVDADGNLSRFAKKRTKSRYITTLINDVQKRNQTPLTATRQTLAQTRRSLREILAKGTAGPSSDEDQKPSTSQ
uniref:Uncharacterized protein LOC108950742 n=1 Tax=Phallusia mammillata TaxID=59560 RepID=A0A6F9DJL1_9ASCI|nr:uncharacterized protein LOC108950742 [Phallusia mammillata]